MLTWHSSYWQSAILQPEHSARHVVFRWHSPCTYPWLLVPHHGSGDVLQKTDRLVGPLWSSWQPLISQGEAEGFGAQGLTVIWKQLSDLFRERSCLRLNKVFLWLFFWTHIPAGCLWAALGLWNVLSRSGHHNHRDIYRANRNRGIRLVAGESHGTGSYNEVAWRLNLSCQTPVLPTMVKPIRP